MKAKRNRTAENQKAWFERWKEHSGKYPKGWFAKLWHAKKIRQYFERDTTVLIDMLHGYKIFSCIPHHLRNEVLREVRKLVSQYREGTPELAMFTVLADRLKEEKAIKDKIDALLAQGMLFGIIDQKTVRRHFEQ